MQVFPKYTICVPIVFFEEIDEELCGKMIDELGYHEYRAQTHQAIRTRNPKAINHLPKILESYPNKTIDVDTLFIEAKEKKSKVESQIKAFPHSTKLQNHLKSLNKQLDFFERIQSAYGVGKCSSITIIY